MATHLAAVIPLKGSPLIVAERRTPTPGPNEVPIRVKSIAVNPVDHYMRGGFHVTTYPAVIGSDISGTIVASGSPDNALPIGKLRIPILSSPNIFVSAFIFSFYQEKVS